MKNEQKFRYWLIANLVLLNSSMLMTWFILGWEAPPYTWPVAGWYFIFTRIIESVILSSKSGFAWRGILLFLQGVSGIFVMGYVVFKALKNAKPQGSKAIAILLLTVVVVFLSSDFADIVLSLPLLGYWLFIVGLLTSAIFEWQKSTFVDATRPS
jgi:hypothetical protein